MIRRTLFLHAGTHPFILLFPLVVALGILLAGCQGPADVEDSYVFTAEDVALYRDLADEATASGAEVALSEADVTPLSATGETVDSVDVDLSLAGTYDALRQGGDDTKNRYQVTNEFLNVRSSPSTNGATVMRMAFGDSLDVLEFLDGMWAKVKLPGGAEGYAAHSYLARVTSEEKLAEEKQQFQGLYTVSFQFVNVRKAPDQKSEKIGEIPGRTIVRPIAIEGDWAKVTFQGTEAYVSTSYLQPFLPKFIVRQDRFTLPVLHYRLKAAEDTEMLLSTVGAHVGALRKSGYSFMTFRGLQDFLLEQQRRDLRLEGKKVIVAVSGITPENVRAASDALTAAGVPATFFLETEHIGMSGITEKRLITLMANGFDLESATHTGDDLRALTSSQAELELKQSRKILEEYTKKPVAAVAYPAGGINDRTEDLAAGAGYLLGLMDGGSRIFSRSEFLRIPGMVIFPATTAEEVVKFAAGE